MYKNGYSEFLENQNIIAKMLEAQKFFLKEAPPDIILIKLKTLTEVEKTLRKAIEKLIEMDVRDQIFPKEGLDIFLSF